VQTKRKRRKLRRRTSHYFGRQYWEPYQKESRRKCSLVLVETKVNRRNQVHRRVQAGGVDVRQIRTRCTHDERVCTCLNQSLQQQPPRRSSHPRWKTDSTQQNSQAQIPTRFILQSSRIQHHTLYQADLEPLHPPKELFSLVVFPPCMVRYYDNFLLCRFMIRFRMGGWRD
jgi:hypothetical protein